NSGWSGIDTFTYTITDGEGSATATVTITVTPVSDPPVASDDTYNAPSSGDLVVDASNGVLANDFDADGDPLTATLLSGPSSGTLNFNSDGSFTYTPPSNFAGSVSFTYEVSDGNGGTDEATVTIHSPGSVSGTVWTDANGNGIRDSGETAY